MHNTIWCPICIPSFMKIGSVVSEELRWQGHLWVLFSVPRGITPTKKRGSIFSADMHNYIWWPIYIPSFMIIGSVVSEELIWQDFGTDRRTDRRSNPTSRPAFAFGDAGKNYNVYEIVFYFIVQISILCSKHSS